MLAKQFLILVFLMIVACSETTNHYDDGVALYRQGKYDEAIAQFQVIAENNAGANNYLGWSYYNLGDYDSAKEYFKISNEMDPNIASNFRGLGTIAFEERDYENTIQYYNQAISLDPVSEKSASAYANTAVAYEKTGKTEEAQKKYSSALTLFPNDEIVLCRVGFFKLRQKEYSEASSFFSKLIAANNDNVCGHQGMGYYCFRNGNYESAIDNFKAALDIDSEDFYNNVGIGWSYYRLGDYDNADKHFNMAIQAQASCWATTGLGMVAYNNNDLEKAREMLDKAYEIEPGCQEAGQLAAVLN